MEFKHEELIEREKEIAGYLLRNFSIKQICDKTGLQKRIIEAHVQNMMEKLGTRDMKLLIEIFKDTRL